MPTPFALLQKTPRRAALCAARPAPWRARRIVRAARIKLAHVGAAD